MVFKLLLRGGIVAWIILPCHTVIYELDPVKNTNKISIFYYFLDQVPKPRYDYLRAFFDPRGQCHHGITGENNPCGQCRQRHIVILIDLVFANLTIKPQKLDYTLCSPFDVFVKIPKNGEWWRQRESNP